MFRSEGDNRVTQGSKTGTIVRMMNNYCTVAVAVSATTSALPVLLLDLQRNDAL